MTMPHTMGEREAEDRLAADQHKRHHGEEGGQDRARQRLVDRQVEQLGSWAATNWLN